MPYDWIFFDVGGPLVIDSAAYEKRIDINLAVLQRYLPALTREQVLEAWHQASGQVGSIDRNLAYLLIEDQEHAKEAWNNVRRQKAARGNYLQLVAVRPEAAGICEQLAKRYKLGLIANQGVGIKEKLTAAGVLQHFTHQKVSEDYGVEKPDPELYKRILSDTGADPKRSVMIDDNIERSLMPAKALGMTTVWYELETRNSVPSGVFDYRITDLRDLLFLFQAST